MFFPNLDVLEESKIVVEDAGHPHSVSGHVANLTSRERLRKTTNIKRARRSRWIATKIAFHRITHYEWSGIDSTTSEISDGCADLRGRRSGRHT